MKNDLNDVTNTMDFTTNTNDEVDLILINVNGSNDPHYRYKMQPIMTDRIAKNGGTTIISNASAIAHDIYRELPDLKSCFAKGLGSKVDIVENTLHIPGDHDVEILQGILQKYINNKVLCEKCGNPETLPHKKKSYKCQACGHICKF